MSQQAVPDPLFVLQMAAGLISDLAFEDLKLTARPEGRDFYTLVAAYLLGIDYHDVMRIERHAVKQGLFARMYTVRPEDMIRVIDRAFGDR